MAHAVWNDPTDFGAAIDRLCDPQGSLAPHPAWLAGIKQTGSALGCPAAAVGAYISGWRRLYTAILLLDHLQDDDPIDDWLAELPTPLRYHLAFSVYAAAQQALSVLATYTSPTRFVRLYGFWTKTVSHLALGQYCDLTGTVTPSNGTADQTLDAYEAIAAQKTGSVFALAFGGSAMLATDDLAQIDAAGAAGLLFGLLLQYQDDLLDAPRQATQRQTPTFVRALAAVHGVDPAAALPATAAWALVYTHYLRGLEPILAPLPESARDAITTSFYTTFGASKQSLGSYWQQAEDVAGP
jgi:hypothetical protein